jgi:uncharacterized protein (TIGR00369 family)
MDGHHGQAKADPAGFQPLMSDLPPSLESPQGFSQIVDYRLLVWRPDHAEVVLEIGPKHLNRSGVLHGGVVATLIDTACGYAGVHAIEPGKIRRAVTLSMTVSFVAQVGLGAVLTARARRTGGGRNIFFSRCEVADGDARLIATGEGTYRYRQGGETPTEAKD